MTRRELLALAAAAAHAAPPPPIVETHIHIFEPAAFPYHPQATYQPPPEPLAPYLEFATKAGISHAVIVQPEPYQDDHRLLWHCFQHESPQGFLRGTILLDPLDEHTPARMEQMVKAHPSRLVTLRIHATNEPGQPPRKSGPIKDRDLADPRMNQVWRKAVDLDLAIQMHFLPHHAPEIGALCRRHPQVRVILDHMGRVGMGTPAGVADVMALAKFPNVYFKYSGWTYFTNPQIKLTDVVKQAHAAFGPDRILWGTLGMNATQYAAAQRLFEEHWTFAPAADQNKIRGLTATKLFRLS